MFEQGGNAAPMSGDVKSLQQKIMYFEKAVKNLERERSQLIVKATMAEE